MKQRTPAWVSAAFLCLLLTGCGDDGETVESTGVDTPGTGAPQTSVLEFSAPSINAGEAAGTATVTIVRTRGNGAVTVNVASRDGTATQPEDYTAVSTTVAFAAGETTPRSATVVISDDSLDEPDETLYLTLTAPSTGGSLGSTSEVLVTINDDDLSAPVAPTAVMSAAFKHLRIDWTSVAGAISYRLMKDTTGSAGFTQVGTDLPATATSVDIDVVLLREDWSNARYVIEACNDAGCTASNAMTVAGMSVPLIGYLKAPSPDEFDDFGYSIALSDDGNTLAVGAPDEDSAARGIGGNQAHGCDSMPAVNCAPFAGAVYIFTRSGSTWSAPVYVKASNTQSFQAFGASVALSRDGTMLAVGAPSEDSAATGINGNQDYNCNFAAPVNCASSSGAVYVYTRSGSTWSGPVYIKASNTQSSQEFGTSVALSQDGTTLAVGASAEDSAAIGINGNQDYVCNSAAPVNCAPSSGAVYIYTRSGPTWTGPIYVKASNTQSSQLFGASVALSRDGTTLAVGALGEGSAATGVDGNQAYNCNTTPEINCAFFSGAVYIYTRSGSTWSSAVYVKASNTGEFDEFGFAVALNGDGSVLAVGAPFEDSAATGIDGNQAYNCNTTQTINCATSSGAAYVYTRSGSTWSGPVYVKASNTGEFDDFGFSVALDRDGSMLAVGAPFEDGGAAGLAGALDGASNNELLESGAGYVYVRDNSSWEPTLYVKASNPDVEDRFGRALAMDADGSALTVGAPSEESAAAGFNGNQADDCGATDEAGDPDEHNCADGSGAVYVY